MEEEKKTAALEDGELDKAAGGNDPGRLQWLCNVCFKLWPKQENDTCPLCGGELLDIDMPVIIVE